MLAAIEREAQLAGESTAEFIRSAAFARACIRYADRGDEHSDRMRQAYDEALEFDRAHPPRDR